MGEFKAFWVEKDESNRVVGVVKAVSEDKLDAGDVTVRVACSSLNYKDALAATGTAKVIERYPCIPGIDLAGEVVASTDNRFRVGDRVLATGYGLGAYHHGGFSERARVPGNWLEHVPESLDFQDAMALGTAGYTAALSIEKMERNGLRPGAAPVIVTGATGGVGSLVISMLAQRGYEVVALTRKAGEESYLAKLGAVDVVPFSDLDLDSSKLLRAGKWSGAVDLVGGNVLGWLVSTMMQSGVIASVGNAAGLSIQSNVLPFILRGVSILGIHSGSPEPEPRKLIWDRLATDLKPAGLREMTNVIELQDLTIFSERLLAGELKGRHVLKIR